MEHLGRSIFYGTIIPLMKKILPIHFINHQKIKDLVAACEEFLNTPLLMMQTVEEADRDDPLIPLKKDFKAFNYYHLPNGNVVGFGNMH